ncbi:MAG: ATP-dependent zinc metalloprotease FtsH, partial [Planctomycetes bacterium]|nr:ATP-dependent zinc metalloprotease FtsH [Planctomycetota bacterium]
MLILSVLLFTSYRRPWGSSPRLIDMGRFDEHLSRGEIGKAWLTDNELKGTLAKPVADYTRFTVVFPPDYLDRQKVDEIRAKVQQFEVKPRNDFWPAVILNIVPWLLLPLLIWFLFFRQVRIPGGTGSVLAFGKSRAKLASKDRTRVTFDDVAGVDEAKQEVREIVEFLKNPSKFQRLGGRIPRGVMLIGPPGTGKTLLAKAIAGEADVPFFSICGADFVEMFVGVGASRVRDLFRQAKENSPCIVFLDEVDAVGRRRGSGLGGGHDEREQTLNAILVEMDGFERDEGIITIAATNRPDVLDPALLRPGRFDREIVLDLADIKGREEILRVHARKVKLGPDVDLKVLARGTPMFSGADLEAVVNEAAILATMDGKELVGMEELEESRDKVKWGKQKRAKIMTEEDRRVTAFHESGHALVAKLHPKVEPLHKVTIIPRGTAL